MSELATASLLNVEPKAESPLLSQNQGTLKTEAGEYTIYAFPESETEAVTKDVSEFLEQINQELPPSFETLKQHVFSTISQHEIELAHVIDQILSEINTTPLDAQAKETTSSQKPSETSQIELNHTQNQTKPSTLPKTFNHPSDALFGVRTAVTTPPLSKPQTFQETYSSVFSLAQSAHKSSFQPKIPTSIRKDSEGKEKNQVTSNGFLNPTISTTTTSSAPPLPNSLKINKDKEEGGQKQQQSQQDDDGEKKQRQRKEEIEKISKKTNATRDPLNIQGKRDEPDGPPEPPLPSMENIFIRFMALMATILGQAEAEAHQLYQRIKQRTDDIDALTQLLAKINSEPKGINWTSDFTMRRLVDRARAMGVDIPFPKGQGKYEWSEDEKKILKENIQMRKDSMEKITQLERTDMQRFLQEASQCHQARSNLLKLLKEVIDTFVHNIRPS